MKKILLLVFLGMMMDAWPQYLRYHSADSVNGKPRHEGFIYVKMKLNGVYDISGGLQGSDVFNIGQINVWDDDNTPNIWMDLYQSQMRFSGSRQIGNRTATGFVEGDFWGGNGHFRLRHAYVRYWFFQFGQDWSFFGDKNVWPNVFDWDGPPSGVWSRAPHLQLFLERPNNWRYEFGIARQTSSDINFSASVDPDVQPASGHPFPDFIAAINKGTPWGHWRLTAMLRRIAYETSSDATSYATGWGVTTSGFVKTHPVKNNSFQFQFVAGSGISSYLASFGGYNMNGLPNGKGELQTIPVVGGWLSYEHYLSQRWHWNVCGGFNELRTGTILSYPYESEYLSLTNGEVTFRGLYMVGNIMYDPFENFTIGLEYNFGYKKNIYEGTIDGRAHSKIEKSRNANRISFGLFYNF